jgi:hypothetical protein
MQLLVGRLSSLRRLSYVNVSTFNLVTRGPTLNFVAPISTLSTKVITVEPLTVDERPHCTSNQRDTIWSASARSRFSLCFGGVLSETGLWSCQGGRSLVPFNEVVLARCLHQKTDDRVEARESNDVGVKVEDKAAQPTEGKLSQKERLKRAVREYGATVIVFHVCISLFTLGVSYAAVSSGIDVVGFLAKIGVGQSILKLASGASTFVMAYAVHKVFAPARIACTLTATPFIVRYLRKIGFLKPPIPKS